jgi:hypothetical protein
MSSAGLEGGTDGTVDDTPTEAIPPARHAARPRLARAIRTFAIPIVLAWVAIVALLNTTVPQLEEVGKLRAVSMSPNDAPALIATKRVGKVFQEYNTSSSVMIVLEGDDRLGADAHSFLRRDGPKTARGHHTHPARPGLLGRYVDRGRRPKHRRQGRLRAGVHLR